MYEEIHFFLIILQVVQFLVLVVRVCPTYYDAKREHKIRYFLYKKE